MIRLFILFWFFRHLYSRFSSLCLSSPSLISQVRDLVDLVSVQCAMLLALRQTTLARATASLRTHATEEQETAMLTRLGALLRDPNVDLAR